ncbi:MAG: hypothetical protein SFZ02_15050 [bacterium]|nr:hypothetical protein [bacterium]
MSEYQYYEFQAIDKRLTDKEKQEIKKLSSRVQPTDTTATFEYNYGDFRHDPYQVLLNYFDAMLYITNWGTHQLMFRFPKGVIPAQVMKQYQFPETMVWTQEKEFCVLNISFDEINNEDMWIEGDGILSEIIPVRDEILYGDYRALYLAWLISADYEASRFDIDDDEVDLEDDELAQIIEPPVPNGLKSLSSALKSFIGFFGISEDLVSASAEKSDSLEKLSKNLEQHLYQLSDDEKLSFLKRILARETRLDIALSNRLKELAGEDKSVMSPAGSRTILDLMKQAEEIKKQRLAEKKRKDAQAHQKKMEQLAPQKDILWAQAEALIAQRKVSGYDEAIPILKDLQALAQYQNEMPQFKEKIATIRQTYRTLKSLLERLNREKL